MTVSKELEHLEKLEDMANEKYDSKEVYEHSIPIEEALQRLEAIDKSNLSEALECLENIGFAPLYEGSDSSYIRIKDEYDEDFNTIKFTLLKAQEFNNVLGKYNIKNIEELENILKIFFMKG